MERWLTIAEFADLAGMSRQAAHLAASQAKKGKVWRGARLMVREASGGRGGRSGVRYEVEMSSLPEALKTALIGSLEASKSLALCERQDVARIPAPNQGQRIYDRWRVMEEALEFPRGSAERIAEIRRASKKWGHSIRTIQRWIRELETRDGDANALARRKPADAGRKRVVVGRAFDKAFLAAGHPAELLPELAARVDQLLKAAWASPAQRHGWKRVALEASTALWIECGKRGLALPQKAFHLTRYRVAEFEHFREVDVHGNDRKRWDDAKPRIRRDNSVYEPMQQIVMDVKPLDCIVMRPDGSAVYPKMVALMDSGTHRIFPFFYLPPLNESVRQEHTIAAFCEMVQDPNWGLPQQLYRDNGTEYFAFDRIRECLAMINEVGARTIINARPYSGASKPIESKFATLDRAVFSQMRGWTGGNRMNSKVQKLGKPIAPYPGSFDEFVTEARERILDFESWDIGSGPFKGRSPMQIYADHLDAGWQPVRVNPVALDAAFARRMEKQVRGGILNIDGERFTHPELPNGQKIEVAVPYRRGAPPVANLPELGWVCLEQEMLHLPGDVAGAIEAGRRQAKAGRKVRTLRKSAGTIDLDANRAARVTALPTRAAPAPLLDIYLASEAEQLGRAQKEAVHRQLAGPTDAERRRAREMRITENLEREQRNARR